MVRYPLSMRRRSHRTHITTTRRTTAAAAAAATIPDEQAPADSCSANDSLPDQSQAPDYAAADNDDDDEEEDAGNGLDQANATATSDHGTCKH